MMAVMGLSPGRAVVEAVSPPHDCSTWGDLVARVRAADAVAFETVVGMLREPGWRLACQMIGDAHQAQDVLQEAFLVLYQRIHTLREPSALRAWFLRIVLNLCRNARRTRTRGPVPVDDAALSQASQPSSGFEERLASQMSVAAAMDTLTPLERAAILLRDYLQLSYQEMAEVLDVPLGTVKSRLSQARASLVRRLKGADFHGAL